MTGAGSILTAMVGLAGAAIGGLTSFVTSWFTQRAQLHQKMRNAARGRRERVYTDFVKEAARLFGDAVQHQREDVSDLITLYALVARMRLIASEHVIRCAEHVLEAIVKAYLAPNRTLHEVRLFVHEGGVDTLRQFSEACRQELEFFEEF